MHKQPSLPAINTIVIGDVGSGKTIVALITALVFMKNLPKVQVAFLAPTEVLAYQHYQNLIDLISRNPNHLAWVEAIFLTGKKGFLNGEKISKTVLNKKLENLGKRQIWVGTQALLFNESLKPTLVLVDEQHRFGVMQRKRLTEAAQNKSHFISFSATPIPRTLALTFFNHLKPLFLESRSKKTPIHTRILNRKLLETEVVDCIQKHLKKNRKVYVVCAKIDSDDENEDTTEVYSLKQVEQIFSKYFKNLILTVHGGEKTKSDILMEFKNNPRKKILIATSVIEVGVDVRAASLIIILNSERFGLAALHQLRGRVGRNDFNDNECLLVVDEKFKFIKRLNYLTKTQDGFKIAQKDLELRGSGEILGKIQSGFDSDIESLMGLDPLEYKEINKIVESIDFQKIKKNQPRLNNYLQKYSKEIWTE